VRLVGEGGELQRGDGPTATRLLPVVHGVRDLPHARQALDSSEVDPLHVADDGDAHVGSVTHRVGPAWAPSHTIAVGDV
jgi:hypothetical protein